MSRLLKKEFLLSMHPVTPLMLLLSTMVLIPNYPYTVMFFYMTLSVFFTCMMGRENHDVIYTMTLPVAKSSIVKARITFVVILELFQMLLIIPFSILRQSLNPMGNEAGIDANIVLLAEGFLLFGIFNLIFFGSYYKNVDKVGISFVKATVVFFILVAADVICTHAVPFVRDCLDTPDSQYLGYKLVTLAAGMAVYIILTILVCRISIKNFEKQDL
ncbi:MAG: ABC-2 transporter permease [Lachnospira sp.]|nr:ABC-2 transporter permease [Lachnospira sp.]